MNKHILVSSRPGLNLFRDQSHAVLLQPLNSVLQIRHLQADMMQALSAPGNKLRDRGIFRGRLEQFEPALADRNHHQIYLFVLDSFFRRNAEAKLFINCFGRRQRLHRNAKMIDAEIHLYSPNLLIRAQRGIWVFRYFPTRPAISSTSVYGSRLCSATSAARAARFPLPKAARAFSSITSRSISTS